MKKILKRNGSADVIRKDSVRKRLLFVSSCAERMVLETLNTTPHGLTDALLLKSQERYGKNIVTQGKKNTLFKRICSAFVNPFCHFAGSRAGFRCNRHYLGISRKQKRCNGHDHHCNGFHLGNSALRSGNTKRQLGCKAVQNDLYDRMCRKNRLRKKRNSD